MSCVVRRLLSALLWVSVGTSQAFSHEVADSVATDTVKKRPWTAGVETAGVNLFLIGYNHQFMSHMPFSQVTMNSIKQNLKDFDWWWDEDYFYTNTMEHPYHGTFYYTSARANGLSVGVSSAYAFGGSLMWELIGENERPSYNDLVTTTVGGITLGEALHRVSDVILDDRSRGLERAGREVLAGVVNPMKGINRLLHGDSWRVNRQRPKRMPMFESALTAGYRTLVTADKPTIRSAYLKWDATYGDVMGEEGRGLFDYFELSTSIAIGGHQSPLNYTRMTAQLCMTDVSQSCVTGLYDHFLYLYSEPEYKSTEAYKKRHPLSYSEVGAIGPGFAYRTGSSARWEQQFYVHGILLGATPMKLVDREHPLVGYSWGSGYGAKVYNRLQVGNWLRVRFDVDYSQLFTWVGYECAEAANLKKVKKSDIQGEAGNAVTLIGSPCVEFWPWRHLGLECRGRYVWHHFNYQHHQHTSLSSEEILLGMSVRL